MKHTRYTIDTKFVRIVKNIVTVLFLIYTSIAVYLIGNNFLSSFKKQTDLIRNPVGFPKSFTLENYISIFVDDKFGKYLINSIVLVAFSLGMLILVSAMVAYGLSRYKFKGRSFLESYFLVGMMFPIQLGILPLFIMLTRMGLNNTLIGVALLYAAGMSFPVFVFSNFFRGIPSDLPESAQIDGATEFQTFFKIIMPISSPVLFTIGLINFVSIWNNFYLPLVFLTKNSVKTLTLGVYTYVNNAASSWSLIFAAASIGLIPVIIVFFIFSDKIIDGMTSGAIKG